MGDLFDALEALEQEVILGGEEEGAKIAQERNFEQGFVFGWQQACHIQRELGMIEGFLCSILQNSTNLKPETRKSISKLITILKSCDQWDPSAEFDIEAKLRNVHTKTKLILKKMNIQSKILDRDIDSEF